MNDIKIIYEIMKKFKISRRCFLSMRAGNIYTTQGTILCDYEFSNPHLADKDVGYTVGSNSVGHRLPSSRGSER